MATCGFSGPPTTINSPLQVLQHSSHSRVHGTSRPQAVACGCALWFVEHGNVKLWTLVSCLLNLTLSRARGTVTHCPFHLKLISTFTAAKYLPPLQKQDRLCGLVVRVLGYRSGGPGSIPGTIRKKSSGSGTGCTQPREYN
jgi:hypothetical protein